MIDIPTANLFMLSTAMGFSVVASYFDLKTGEIPDKFSIGLVAAALAMRAAFSVMLGDYVYFLDGAAVAAIFFAFGALLFYTGGWGGGDAKLIAGIGAALGGIAAPSIMGSAAIFPAFFGFFVALSVIAIPYSLTYAFILAVTHMKVFSLFGGRVRKNWFIAVLGVVIAVSLFIMAKPHSYVMMLALALPAIYYPLLAFTRSVEEIAMQREVTVKELREGDLVAEDLVIRGKKLASSRDMDGLTKEAIKAIRASRKQLPKKIRIKWGIRFAPAFPLAIAISPFWSAILMWAV